ncbi:Uncharacterised protein [uncultured Blautia sp.]|nr:Uncharacterised protein [uncultured Blautia sp.]
MILADFLQVGKIRDDGNLLTGKGQVDESYNPMAAAADCRPLKFCHLPIIEAVQPLGQIVQFIHCHVTSDQLLQDGGVVLDFPDKAVLLDWVSNLHFPQQFQAAAVFIFPNREWDGCLSILRVLRVAQYGLHFVLPPVPPSRRTTDP